MSNVFLHLKWRSLVAINLIAVQAVFTGVSAQNSVQNLGIQNPAAAIAQTQTQSPVTAAEQRSAEDAERLRISQLRAAADAEFDIAKQACYQKFAVNTCIATAREKQRSEVIDLKRQEIALNDADRQRRGADQLRRTEAKALPDAQAQAAAQNSSALAAAAQRQDKQAGKARAQQSSAQSAQQNAQIRSQNMQRKQVDAAKAAAQRQSAASAKAAQSKARYKERMKEAEEKRAKVLAKKPTKPPAAGLPIPPSAP